MIVVPRPPAPAVTPDEDLRGALTRFLGTSSAPLYLRSAASVWLNRPTTER